MISETYNGHKNWHHWNVSLWIANDEGLYSVARDCIRSEGSATAAAKAFMACLRDMGMDETPDGAPYTVTTVRAALIGLLDRSIH